MPFEAYKLYQEYEPDKYKTSTQKKTEGVLKEAEEMKRAQGKETISGVEFQEAKEIFGEDLLGPEEIEKTWGFRPDEIPEILFTREQLERAKEMGQMLLLRVEQTEDGKPMSLETINDILVKKWEKESKGEILKTADGWKNWIGEDRFKKEAPRSGWALVSKDWLPDSTSKNYIEQTDIIIKALREEAFKDIEVPEEYEEAIREFEANKDRLTNLMSTNWQEAAKQLSELKITKLTRQIFPEAIYDIAMYHDRHNKRMLSGKYAWTASLNPDGSLVSLGDFDARGVRGHGRTPDDRNGNLSASLSRSVTKLVYLMDELCVCLIQPPTILPISCRRLS